MDANYSLTKLYHPSGAQLTIPLDLNVEISADQAALLIRSVDALLLAGFSVNAPGLDDGELLEEISAVAKREGSDETVIVDFYSSNTKLVKKFMHAYMNTVEDVDAFEYATGVKIASIPTFEGNIAIERTNKNAAKYVKNLPRPIKLVYKISPKWEQWKQAGGEGKEPHKKLLVRYETDRKPALAADPATGEIVTEQSAETAPGAIPQQYKKSDGNFVQMLVKQTGLKPTDIMPILAKISGDTISFESAVKIIAANLSTTEN
ncbi:MAG: hypothetical protein PHQ36_07755 [Anaerolineales bacterium]|nr:hypothetical protein [Anaerolineales bacterium]